MTPLDRHFLVSRDAGKQSSSVRWSGVLTVDPGELHRAIRDGWLRDGVEGWYVAPNLEDGKVLFLPKPNLVVDTGITRVQNLGWGIGGVSQVVNCMGVDNGTGSPAPGTTSEASDGTITSNNIRIQALDSTATQTSKVVSNVSTFTSTTISFIMRRLALSFIASGSLPITTTAGVPASSLHSMTGQFTIDLTTFTTWSQTFTATVTGVGA